MFSGCFSATRLVFFVPTKVLHFEMNACLCTYTRILYQHESGSVTRNISVHQRGVESATPPNGWVVVKILKQPSRVVNGCRMSSYPTSAIRQWTGVERFLCNLLFSPHGSYACREQKRTRFGLNGLNTNPCTSAETPNRLHMRLGTTVRNGCFALQLLLGGSRGGAGRVV